jgi:hypothetical protein
MMTVQSAQTDQAMMDDETAVMALLTAVLGGGQTDMICSAAHMSGFGGMIPMYLLMCAFHLAPWLGLIVRWRGRRRGGLMWLAPQGGT